MKKILVLFGFIICSIANAQKANEDIVNGNEAYRKGDFAAAANAYEAALKKDPASDAARFNLANALQRQNNSEASQQYYDDIIQSSQLNSMKAASQYNKGVAYVNQKKLGEAIQGFKNALKLDPDDEDARENLQKALNEKNRQQQQQNKPQNQPQQQPKDKKPPPPQKLNQQLMQQKFNELRKEEKQLQQKLQDKQTNTQQEKDW